MTAPTQPTTTNPTTNSVNEPAANDGVQKRIDELTAARGDVERKYQELEQQHAALKLKYENTAAAVAATLGVPGHQPNQPQVDPNLQAAIQAALAPTLAQLQQQFGQLQYANHQRALHESFTQYGVPEPVQKRALEIQQEYASKGTFIKPEVARRYAWGEIAEQEAAKAAQANAQRQNFNQPYANLGNGAQLPLASPLAGKEKPANFESMPAGEQARWYQQNLGNVPL